MKRWLILLMLLILGACGRASETSQATKWQYIFQSGTVLEFSGVWQLHEQFIPGIIVFNQDVPMQIVEFTPDKYDEQMAGLQEYLIVETLDLHENLMVYYHRRQADENQQGIFLVVLPDRTSLGVTITAATVSDYLPAVHDILATAHKPTYNENIFAFDGQYMMLYPTTWEIDLNAGDAPYFITEHTIIAFWSYSGEMLSHLFPSTDPNDLIQLTQSVVQLGVNIPTEEIELTEIAEHPVAIYRRPSGTSQAIVFILDDYRFSVTFGSRTGETINPEDEAAIYAMIESLITNARSIDD